MTTIEQLSLAGRAVESELVGLPMRQTMSFLLGLEDEDETRVFVSTLLASYLPDDASDKDADALVQAFCIGLTAGVTAERVRGRSGIER